MNNAEDIFLKPMKALFTAPYQKTDDELVVIINEYISTLSKYPDDVLTEAWERIKVSHNKNGWPLLARIIEVCNSIEPRGTQQAVEWQLTDHQILTSEEGQEALREGHGNNYLVACRNVNKILPAEPTIRKNSNLDYSDLTGKGREMYLNHIEEMKIKEAKLKEKYYG